MSLLATLTYVFSTISTLPTNQLSIAAAMLGAASHWTYFIHHERDLQFWTFFLAVVTAPPTFACQLYLFAGIHPAYAVSVAMTITASYLAALTASIIIYRLWFHPVRKFPGPFMARITKLYYIYAYSASNRQYYRLQKSWFEKYGDIVRTGPNELIVNRPEIVPHLSQAAKGTWYNIGVTGTSLQLLRDRHTHNIRRRVWDRAFSHAAVTSYLPRIRHYTDKLLDALAGGGTEKNITAWLSYYAFDVMGAVTYGRDFGMLKKAGADNSDYFLRMTHASMRVLGMLAHVPWTLLLLERLGMAGKDHYKFLAWCEEMVDRRKNSGKAEAGNDLFETLFEAEPNNKPPHHVPLRGDSRTAIIAGSDTTASTLIGLFVYLAASPPVLKKLQRELDALPPDSVDSPYLEACISEALRLNPAVPSGVARTTPELGITLEDGTFLPGGINILFPLWPALRDQRWFEMPGEFWPERWLESSPEEIAQMKAVFHPFWLGRHQCVGKLLAMTQMRIATAAIVRRFDLELVGSVEQAFEGCIDTYTIEMGEVQCVITEREMR